jgi:hypothetical protein
MKEQEHQGNGIESYGDIQYACIVIPQPEVEKMDDVLTRAQVYG